MPMTDAQTLAQTRQALTDVYRQHRNPQLFFRDYGAALDALLADVWQTLPNTAGLCLLATGGYGRGEMYPYSDMDLALVAAEPLTPAQQDCAARLIQKLWDIGLTPALKAGGVRELCLAAAEDLTGDTALLEARFLCGEAELGTQLLKALDLQRDVMAFMEGKLLEMQQRHDKASGSGSLLEPNVKTCPGGLRDIHTMVWLAKVQGMAPRADTLIQRGILSRTEWGVLMNSHRTLARIRIELHLAAGRAEERLIFDLQLQVASALGHHDAEAHLKSEKLMRTLYRATKSVKQLNGILLPMLRGRVYSLLPRVVRNIDDDYYQVGNLLAVKDKSLFRRQPSHLFKALQIWQQHSDLSGLAPQTLRAWWQAAQKQVNAAFYANPVNRGRFIGFFRQGGGLTHLLRFLNLYGVLGRYLPDWEKIVGLLQHDLIHVYPVDDHILTVVRNMRRLAIDAHQHELPFASGLMASFEQPHILYLAALFHDIAKGRGGDHAQLGMADARRFAADHFLSAEEEELLVWLVADHLLMSLTAQKEDIQDPAVVARFCQRVQTRRRLTALYLLTVADIRGTNPKIWNSWKAGLLENLFRSALAHLGGHAADRHLAISRRQQSGREVLAAAGFGEADCRRLWQLLGAAYFVHHDESLIRWHLPLLAAAPEQPQAHIRPLPHAEGLQVFVLMPNRDRLFAGLCRLFGRLNLGILAAHAYVSDHNYVLDTFALELPPHSQSSDIERIRRRLAQALDDFVHLRAYPAAPTPAPPSRRVRHLPIAPRILLSSEGDSREYALEIITANRRYLLADIAEVLSELDISLRHAKIATMDERVEDSFLIRHPQLDDTAFQLKLKQRLLEKIGS